MVQCPSCDASIDVDEDELDEGDEFTCEECGANLAVVSLSPLEIEPAKDEEETDDDADDDDDDDDAVDDDEEKEEDEEDESWR